MANKTFYGEEARIKILKGAANIYEAVSVTAGKHGQNVTISGPYGPSSTHDGVKVAMSYNPEITEETLGEEAGSDFVRAAAAKTNDTVGDGTTASTILTYHLIREAYKLVAAGHNPMVLKRELDEATEEMLANIPSLTEEIKGDIKRITQVATISAGDYEIGKLIAEVISEIGEDGAVSVETSDTIGLNKEITQGYKFDRGYIALSQITDPSKMVASYSDVPILITDRKITTFWEIQPLLEEIAKSGKKELVIIADDVDGEALSTLVLNHHKGLFKTVCIKAPAMGERRHDLLEDIAIATGGIVISEEVGLDFRSANMDCLGYAKRIIVTRDSTTIIDGQGDHEVIADRTSLIKELLTSASSGDKPLIERRLAALIGKAGVIRVGGITEGEIEEKKDRVDDAVAATKAAVAEGIVAGGGVTLINLARAIDAKTLGGDILARACLQPFLKLMNNAGLKGDLNLHKVIESDKMGMGFDLDDDTKLQDMKKIGIVDPALVVREVIQNSVAQAGLAITTGAIIAEIPPK